MPKHAHRCGCGCGCGEYGVIDRATSSQRLVVEAIRWCHVVLVATVLLLRAGVVLGLHGHGLAGGLDYYGSTHGRGHGDGGQRRPFGFHTRSIGCSISSADVGSACSLVR